MLPDIQTEHDIRRIVDAFYGGIERHEGLGRFFEGHDLQAHLPRMYAFWASIVFRTGTYRGRPFEAHARLDGLSEAHFAQWLDRFHATVDAHFQGPRAEAMKEAASRIAIVFQVKLGLQAPAETL